MDEEKEKWSSGLLEGVDYVQDGTLEYFSECMKGQLEETFNQCNQERRTLFKAKLEALSEEAIEVASLVINTPTELLDMVLQKSSPHLTKSELKVFLRSKGWSFKNILSAFSEIKNIFKSPKKCGIIKADVDKYETKTQTKEVRKMTEAKPITLTKLKEFAKAVSLAGYSKMKLAEIKKPLMEAMAKLAAEDKKWRNAKKNQEMINWFNIEVDAHAAANKQKEVDAKKKAKTKGKTKAKEKEEVKKETLDFSKMDHPALVAYALDNLGKLNIKKKKVKGMTEKKLRKTLTKVFTPKDIQTTKGKADEVKKKAADKKKDTKKKKKSSAGRVPPPDKIIMKAYKIWKKNKKIKLADLHKKIGGETAMRKGQLNGFYYAWKVGKRIPKGK